MKSEWSIWKCNINLPPLFLQKSLMCEQVTWEKFLYEQNTLQIESEIGRASDIASVI